MSTIQTILHPTDFSERSDGALPIAQALARDQGARLVVLHVMDESAPAAAVRATVPDARVRMEQRLEKGDPAETILRVASEIKCDLIVMGTQGRTGLERLVMGSVAEKVLRQATCPVLIVKG
jgi:nucleotide-binding universal stress UspA family protein